MDKNHLKNTKHNNIQVFTHSTTLHPIRLLPVYLQYYSSLAQVLKYLTYNETCIAPSIGLFYIQFLLVFGPIDYMILNMCTNLKIRNSLIFMQKTYTS